jgi:hypothetical protein
VEARARAYGVDEVVIVTITESRETRLRSYALLAEAFGLPRREGEEAGPGAPGGHDPGARLR